MNAIQLNNWKFRDFAALVIIIQLAIIGLAFIGSEEGSEEVILLLCREFASVFFLLCIPGFIVLRILKVHDLADTHTVLYATGISVAFIMIFGFALNLVMHFIQMRMDEFSVVLSYFSIVNLLLFLSYRCDRNYVGSRSISGKPDRSLPKRYLLLALVLLLAADGALVVTQYINNSILVLLFIAIVAILILIGTDRVFDKKDYAIAIYLIALALLLHHTLVSGHLEGWNVDREYHYAKLVLDSGYWDITIPDNVNSALSITILVPIISWISNIDPVWIFKAVFPLIFSLVPLAIYETTRGQIGQKGAFFAAFFFISMFDFFTEMPMIGKQQIAELFIVLFILTLISERMPLFQKSFLALLFIFCIPISHYGIVYIFIILLAAAFFMAVIASALHKRLTKGLTAGERVADINLKMLYLVILVLFTLIWSQYVSQGSALSTLTQIIEYSVCNMFNFANLNNSESPINAALGGGFFYASFISILRRSIFYVTQLLVIIGMLKLILAGKKEKLNPVYRYLIITTGIFLILCIFIPYIGEKFSISRLYHFTLLIISPLLVIGGVFLVQILVAARNKVSSHDSFPAKSLQISHERVLIGFILPILIIYFIFNVGLVDYVGYQLGISNSLTPSLGYEIMNTRHVSTMDVIGSLWITNYSNPDYFSYSDLNCYALLDDFMKGRNLCIADNMTIPGHAYIYLGTDNTKMDLYSVITGNGKADLSLLQHQILYNHLNESGLIYNNAGSQIYFHD